MCVRERHETAVDGLVARPAELVAAEESDGTGAALAFSAALLRARAPRRAQPFEQRAMRVDIVYDDGLPIELEHHTAECDTVEYDTVVYDTIEHPTVEHRSGHLRGQYTPRPTLMHGGQPRRPLAGVALEAMLQQRGSAACAT
jgi:hypothetical protein